MSLEIVLAVRLSRIEWEKKTMLRKKLLGLAIGAALAVGMSDVANAQGSCRNYPRNYGAGYGSYRPIYVPVPNYGYNSYYGGYNRGLGYYGNSFYGNSYYGNSFYGGGFPSYRTNVYGTGTGYGMGGFPPYGAYGVGGSGFSIYFGR
jgi:hypothetical protein